MALIMPIVTVSKPRGLPIAIAHSPGTEFLSCPVSIWCGFNFYHCHISNPIRTFNLSSKLRPSQGHLNCICLCYHIGEQVTILVKMNPPGTALHAFFRNRSLIPEEAAKQGLLKASGIDWQPCALH